jgi:hypothetical protein
MRFVFLCFNKRIPRTYQCRCCFVKQKNSGIQNERSSDGHTRSLTARSEQEKRDVKQRCEREMWKKMWKRDVKRRYHKCERVRSDKRDMKEMYRDEREIKSDTYTWKIDKDERDVKKMSKTWKSWNRDVKRDLKRDVKKRTLHIWTKKQKMNCLQLHSSFAHFGLISFFKLHNEIVTICFSRSIKHHFFWNQTFILNAKQNVVTNRSGKQRWFFGGKRVKNAIEIIFRRRNTKPCVTNPISLLYNDGSSSLKSIPLCNIFPLFGS